MAFMHSGFPEIRAIFLAQFHPDLGPIVRLSVPEDAVDVEQRVYNDQVCIKNDDMRISGLMAALDGSFSPSCFDQEPAEVIELIKRPEPDRPAVDSSKIDFNSIQTLIIPKLTLFERLITVNTGRHKVMCYPIAVEGNYPRNVFIFNMCFAFDIDADTKCYGAVVKRVGCLLKELEITGNLLSDPEGTRPLVTMMRQLVSKLNAHGEYQIELDLKGLSQPMASTGISIKLFPYYENPKTIEPYHVPVKLVDFDIAKRKSAQTVYQEHASNDIMWDLVLDKVTECIDNINHVRRIAQLTLIREETVVLALKHLDYYGCIALVDIFQFSNVYEGQYQVMDIFRNAWLQRECHNYVTRDGQAGSISIEKLIHLYSTIRQRKSVADWIVDNDVDVERFDVRRFFMFGVLHQMLRRVHCYPVLCKPAGGSAQQSSESSEASSVLEEEPGQLGARVLGMLDGTHHLDEIGITAEKDTATMRELLDKHGNIEYILL
ncbi:Nitrogen permease regulator 2 [Coemansia sp. Cherry 401B]|nr:Nitrogen permease regulator 2 [Coemansia sp. RSA 2610]KAJ2737983.1 Nitrogen permease regulator 2 [Coemansia sp. Cherry 401B]